ncbi:hypothetical protein EJ110_NYTH35559 [Nymphaea thermarum]|nr:hypothetical protein EJ110_NYTH35559 [Nymphaea thermarum]
MEDVITDFPPPSCLFLDDLNNFSSLPHPLPSPFLLLSNPNPNAEPSSLLEPFLLIVAVSRPSRHPPFSSTTSAEDPSSEP